MMGRILYPSRVLHRRPSLLRMSVPFLLLLFLFLMFVAMLFSQLISLVWTLRAPHRIADVPVGTADDELSAGSMTSLLHWLSTRPAARADFGDIFELRESTAPLVIPAEFRAKALAMFAAYGGTADALLRALEAQRVVDVRNRVTGDAAAFNGIRRFRPGGGKTEPRGSHNKGGPFSKSNGESNDSGAAACDFCSRVRLADDIFGRIAGRHAFTASNVAKLSRFHGLIVPRAHDPLAFSAEVLADVLDVSHQWFRRAHREDPRHAFPNIFCDIGPRASASQPHLHLQTVLSRARHAAGIDQWMRAAQAEGNAFWARLVRAHDAVGLAVRVGRSVVLSSACPRKERELIVLADSPEDPSFARAVAVALTTLRDAANVQTMSFALSFPPLDSAGEYRIGKEPALLRVIDRGDPNDTRADTGALEYFGTAYIAADPFDIVPHLVRARDALEHKL